MNDLLEKPINDQKIIDILSFLPKDNKLIQPTDLAHTADISTSGTPLGLDLPETEAELFKLEQYPLLDEKDGIEKAGGSQELLKEILTMLVDQSIPEELSNLKIAYTKQDWDSIQKIAHKMKGGALYCGTIRMLYACQYLERYRLAGHNKLLEQLYQQLIIVLEDTRLFASQHLI
jgi:two-component system aerobic respiration control sensor histidine kinase ArcB